MLAVGAIIPPLTKIKYLIIVYCKTHRIIKCGHATNNAAHCGKPAALKFPKSDHRCTRNRCHTRPHTLTPENRPHLEETTHQVVQIHDQPTAAAKSPPGRHIMICSRVVPAADTCWITFRGPAAGTFLSTPCFQHMTPPVFRAHSHATTAVGIVVWARDPPALSHRGPGDQRTHQSGRRRIRSMGRQRSIFALHTCFVTSATI